MSVILTERAAQEIKRSVTEGNIPADMFVRVGVAGGGCSGFQYSLGFDNQFDSKADSKFEVHGVTIVVDKKSSLYLDGTTLDYMDGLDKRGFHFQNPNAVKTCGCGSSFQA